VNDASHAELRGWAARHVLAEDACWVADITFSSQAAGDCQAYPALLLGHHFVRIAYEGAKAIRSRNPNVGWSGLAELLSEQYAPITERARHVSKLLDDTKKSDEVVLAELRAVQEHNTKSLTGKAPRFLRWLESDLGLFSMGGSTVGASMPIAYRLGLDPKDPHTMSGEDLHRVAQEWGATMSVLMAAALEPPSDKATLGLANCGVSYRDRLAAKYLADHYEADFEIELKLLLLMIEGDLHTNRLFLPLTESGHEMPAFRARVVTLYHSLTSLQRIFESHPRCDTPAARSILALFQDEPTRRLLSQGGKQVRNRCVHYEMSDPRIIPDQTLPMFGIIESVNPGTTWHAFNQDVLKVTDRLAECLSGWRLSKSR